MRGPRLGLLVALLLSACACKQKGAGGSRPPGDGGGGGADIDRSGDPARCDGIDGKVRGLYEASAERTKLTPEEVRDNTAMVLAECRGAPDHVIACAQRVTSVAQLERECLAPLDDEGSEGLQFEGK